MSRCGMAQAERGHEACARAWQALLVDWGSASRASSWLALSSSLLRGRSGTRGQVEV